MSSIAQRDRSALTTNVWRAVCSTMIVHTERYVRMVNALKVAGITETAHHIFSVMRECV
jgi:hypothetical protein